VWIIGVVDHVPVPALVHKHVWILGDPFLGHATVPGRGENDRGGHTIWVAVCRRKKTVHAILHHTTM
jgi:hypothetical protein